MVDWCMVWWWVQLVGGVAVDLASECIVVDSAGGWCGGEFSW